MESPRCRVCLSTDRLLSRLTGTNKTCFLELLTAVSATQSDIEEIFLCWECKAHLTRIVKFKDAVQAAERGLLCVTNKTQPRLQHQILPSLSYNPEENETKDDIFEVMLLDTNIIESDKSDNEFLGDIKERIKKVCKKKKVKKKKKKSIPVFGANGSWMYTEITLDKDGIMREREQLLQKEEYINAVYKCERCIKVFPNAEDMEEHNTNKHSLVTQYKCTICECYSNTEVSHNYHSARHRTRFQCRTCVHNFQSKRDVVKHYNETHCYGSNMTYKRETTDSKEYDHDMLEFACDSCSKRFKWKTSLRKHVETHRIEAGLKRKPYCETCKLTFTTTANLQKHVKTSSKHQIQLKLRKLQDLPTSAQKSLEEITREVTANVKRHKCEACGRQFQWRGNLLRHVSSHEARAKGELVCAPCNRTFSSIATYKQHLKISKKHVSENDFKYMCSECGRRFFNRTRLKEHAANVHERTFAKNKHKMDNNALCHYCGKQAQSPAKLRTHIKAVHSQCSPFVCEVCHSSFSWHSCLSRHVRRAHGNTKL